MSLELGAQIIIAVLGITALAFQAVHRRGGVDRRRAQIKFDAEIVSLLPEDAAARRALLDHVGNRVKALIEDETIRRRHYGGAVTGGFWSVIGTSMVASVLYADPPPPNPQLVFVAGIGFALGGAVMAVMSLRKVERAADGSAIWRKRSTGKTADRPLADHNPT